MNWIDIRVRKPTRADSDNDGRVVQLMRDGSFGSFHWSSLAGCVAWLDIGSLPKFTPIPDPPEGYRWIDKERDKPKRQDDLYWSEPAKSWKECGVGFDWFCPDDAYARRIDPPKPTPPEGYELAGEGDGRDRLYWSVADNTWKPIGFDESGVWRSGNIKAVPQYRPFGIAAEWLPHKDRDVVNADKQFQRWMTYTDFCIRFPSRLYTWEEAFKVFKFADGTPFGIKVE
jgi:hypothetical protein